MYRDVAEAMAAGLDDDRREGMVNTMGGHILKLQAEIWMEEGMEKGMKKEKVNTDREKKRADEEKLRADKSERQLEEERRKHEEENKVLKREIERLKAAAN